MTLVADPLTQKFPSRPAVRISGLQREEGERTLNTRPVVPLEFLLDKQRSRRGEINKKRKRIRGAEPNWSTAETAVKRSSLEEMVSELEYGRIRQASIGLMNKSALAALVFAASLGISATGGVHFVHPALAGVGLLFSLVFWLMGWLNSRQYEEGFSA